MANIPGGHVAHSFDLRRRRSKHMSFDSLCVWREREADERWQVVYPAEFENEPAGQG
jgi:hypothetical protein